MVICIYMYKTRAPEGSRASTHYVSFLVPESFHPALVVDEEVGACEGNRCDDVVGLRTSLIVVLPEVFVRPSSSQLRQPKTHAVVDRRHSSKLQFEDRKCIVLSGSGFLMLSTCFSRR